MESKFGEFIKESREALRTTHGDEYSLRNVAARIGVTPGYLSQVENDKGAVPAEQRVLQLAEVLKLDCNIALAVAGRVSTELQDIILKRPALFAEILTALRDMPDTAILHVVREVRNGDW